MNTNLKKLIWSLLALFLSINFSQAQFVDYDPAYYAANDFELTNLEIPVSEIYPGGDNRLGIPMLNQPVYETISSAQKWLSDDEMVLGVWYKGEAKAFPIRIISWHEVVETQFGREKVMVTYAPLTASGQAYAGADFGISALVYNNNTLLYDKETRSLWTQLDGHAVTGEKAAKKLKQIPVVYTNWGNWKAKFADTKVLSINNGQGIDYSKAAYAKYEETVELPYPVSITKNKLPFKSKVIGIEVDGKFKAYPFSRLTASTEDFFNGMKIRIQYNHETNATWVTDEEGTLIPSVVCYWYAWYAFHYDTKIYGFLPKVVPLAVVNEE